MTHSTTPTTHKQIQLARLSLAVQIPEQRISLLRKTVSAVAGGEDDLLHNHASRERVIYRYPLVQYKSIMDQASILGIGENGCQSLEKLLGNREFTAIFSQEGLTSLEKENLDLGLTEAATIQYRLRNWLPFNDSNHQKYAQTASLASRMSLLEGCLTGHILKFCSAIGWLLPPRSLQVALTDIRPLRSKLVHNNHFHGAFDILFQSNILLPDGIGLGKAVSHGFGILQRLE